MFFFFSWIRTLFCRWSTGVFSCWLIFNSHTFVCFSFQLKKKHASYTLFISLYFALASDRTIDSKIFFFPPPIIDIAFTAFERSFYFFIFFFKFCFSQSGFRSDSGVCRLESGFVASTRAAQTQLVTCRLASMSDIWNIHICVAAQCGGIESAKTFDNPGLLSSFLLMQRVGFSSGEPCCSETCYRSSLVRGL